jgi:sensor histidine kinase regulating citrate/malate metabolism
LAVLSLLYLLDNLFENKKYINKLSNALRIIGISFYIAAGYIVFCVQNVEIISFVWIIVATIPFILMVRMVNYSFQNSVTYQKDTEENAALNLKFQACFDNIKEAIILISDGQIEYVNDSFLL